MPTDMRALDYTVRMLGTVHEMHIIAQLLQAPCSIDQLSSIGPKHSRRELTVCLTHLTQRGVIERPEAVYQLTPIGESLYPIFHAIEKQTQHP
ncbi:winged helix-turn-helix transcriptional regulator [Exiguobacterium sp. 17-1]|uniref:winged helix-turn-helix transcriptional regulator n=1 Tax=Exiguobacterium sp. 17-1 TaxID=2931981 RepID=UPI001FFE719F|nr:winged helix-turn-helix transcriptional regulator [Exiguobacterium sp. 17-1]MCK2157524.1 winged helix-turn-helix transcriptional regulator [Exiguobacterium sp. 17-1]